MDNENLIYWEGRPVGIETAGQVAWFPSAPAGAIQNDSAEGTAMKTCKPPKASTTLSGGNSPTPPKPQSVERSGGNSPTPKPPKTVEP